MKVLYSQASLVFTKESNKVPNGIPYGCSNKSAKLGYLPKDQY